MYPAQFFRHKNHLRLAEAFALVLKEYPDCHLLLTGKRKYEFDKVMSRVAELGIQNRVKHLGYLDASSAGRGLLARQVGRHTHAVREYQHSDL